jgi:hypothetical protein
MYILQGLFIFKFVNNLPFAVPASHFKDCAFFARFVVYGIGCSHVPAV